MNFIFEKCKIVHISKGISNHAEKILNKYPMKLFTNFRNVKYYLCVIGVFNDFDLSIIKQAVKNRLNVFIIWVGTDCHILHNYKKVVKSSFIRHYSISPIIYENLKNSQLHPYQINFSIVDESHFLSKKENVKQRNCVYIFNGLKEYDRTLLFGKPIYESVVHTLTDKYQFDMEQIIFSNELSVKYNQMNTIYEKCFIGLRLCQVDGNSNTVQEMKLMNIPIIHNCSDYGIKWKTEQDIINIILQYYHQLF